MTEQIETVIVGGGQAGLALSYYLTQQDRPHVVLEQSRIGESWRSQRWDSFTLVTPNWMTQLPGFAYQGEEPDSFLPREQVVAYLERYAQFFQAPLRCGVRATSVQLKSGGGYLIETNDTAFTAANVVLATGGYPLPKLPPASAALPANLLQLHTSQYRNPQLLPPGAVLVVGTGPSGCQIAEELQQSGRQVYLSLSSCGRLPRRYRGKDVMWWRNCMGLFDQLVEQLSTPTAKFVCNPHVSGKNGGHDINLRQLAREGVVLLGRLQAIQGNRVILAPDLEENLAKADAFATQEIQAIDAYIEQTGMEVVEESMTEQPHPNGTLAVEPVLALDLQALGLSTVIWATGYQPNFSWVQVPVFDKAGHPLHQRGVTASPGLYFLGLPWQYKRKSSLLFGIGEDAAFLASVIAARR